MILTDILEQNAKFFPNKTALIMRMGYRNVTLTFAEVHEHATRVACLLEQEGVKKGDKILLLAPNSPYWICVFWGCLLRGAVLVPLNIESTAEFVQKIAKQTEAKLFFKHKEFRGKTTSELKTFDIVKLSELAVKSQKSKVKVDETDVAEIVYTSGTTGEPKGVVLTHKNIMSNVETLSRAVPLSQQDRMLSVLPLFHMFEQVAGFLVPFQQSATIVYAHSIAAIPELLREHRITKMAAVPELLRVMLSRIETKAKSKGKKKQLETLFALSKIVAWKPIQRLLFRRLHQTLGGRLSMIACGGAPLDPELEKKWNAFGIDIMQGYGLTETSPAVSTNTFKKRRVGSVGKILPRVEVRITNDGEILVKGPNVFHGYFKSPSKTKAAFTKDDWFRTDDIGELDDEGFLYIKGRKKYMILGPGGQNVYPEDIEFVLNNISGVSDSCVLGLEKAGGNVEIHAVLLLETAKAEPEIIISSANKKLASYQRIARWSVWPERDFPRSATRKVKKEEVLTFLREQQKKAVLKTKKEKSPLMELLADIADADIGTLKPSTKFIQALGYDSLLRVELVTRIEEQFGVHIDEAKIRPETNVADLEKLVEAAEPAKPKQPFKEWPMSWWAKTLRSYVQTLFVFPFVKIFVKLKVEGLEHLADLSLPVIFMPNHLSYLDSIAVAMALPRRVRKRLSFAGAQDVVYEKYRRVSWILELLANVFPFPRREGERIVDGLIYVGKMLDEGHSVVVFPEGRMSTTGDLLPLKRGAGLMATEMHVPIVPILLRGTDTVLPPGKIIPRQHARVTVTFGKPLDLQGEASYIDATKKIENAMRQLY